MNWTKFRVEAKKARIQKALTQQDIADMLNVTSQFICLFESGKKKLSADKLVALAKILNLEIS